MATVAVQNVESDRSAGRFYRPELDVLRFIAFGMVFLSHAVGQYRLADVGILGVPVFFMLSAFLITELLLQEKQKTGTVHVSSFYIRRILRIWPLYFAALALGSLFVWPWRAVTTIFHFPEFFIPCCLRATGGLHFMVTFWGEWGRFGASPWRSSFICFGL